MLLTWRVLAAAGEPSSPTQGVDPWFAPTIGLVGVVAGAFVVGWLTSRRERVARRQESQRAALYALQEAAHRLRLALEAYGRAEEPSKKLTKALDDATGQLQITKHRIVCETVRSRVDDWYAVAYPYYLNDQEVTLAQTDKAWDQLQFDVGIELRRQV